MELVVCFLCNSVWSEATQLALFIKLQMISFTDDPFFFVLFFCKWLYFVLRELLIAIETWQQLNLNGIIFWEATDVFFSLAIFVISHQFRWAARVKIKLMPAEIKLQSHVCQENAWRANQEREKTQWWEWWSKLPKKSTEIKEMHKNYSIFLWSGLIQIEWHC